MAENGARQEAKLSVELDALGVVRAHHSGFFTEEQVDNYLAIMAQKLAASRARFGFAKMIVDLRDSVVQTTAVSERFGRFDEAVRQENDRVAFVVQSKLLEMQLKRQVEQLAGAATFLSMREAETWIEDQK
jgi:hypothetical protein